MVFPVRCSLTHAGGAPSGPAVCTESALSLTRRWNAKPFPGEPIIIACLDPGVSDARIMTPAFVHRSTYSRLCTRATIAPSPVIVRYAKWNASAAPQMSAPDPLTVNTPLSYAVLPAAPTAPTSWAAQPAGSPAGGSGDVT